MPITKCIECEIEFEYVTNKPPRCDSCKRKRRARYLTKYKNTNEYLQYTHKHNLEQRKYVDMHCPCKKCGKLIKYKTAIKWYCDECKRIIYKKRAKRYRENKQETTKQKEKRLKQQREYREKNREKLAEYQRNYRQTKHGKKIIKQYQESSKKNGKYKKKIRLMRRRRREKLRCVIHNYTDEEWNEKLNKTNGICPGYKCESHFVGVEKLTLDHIYPLKIAHDDYKKTKEKRIYTINDVQPLCIKCNNKKHIKVIN